MYARNALRENDRFDLVALNAGFAKNPPPTTAAMLDYIGHAVSPVVAGVAEYVRYVRPATLSIL